MRRWRVEDDVALAEGIGNGLCQEGFLPTVRGNAWRVEVKA